MNYSVSGAATAGGDFTTLSGSVTVLAGQTAATIDVEVLDDAFPENIEDVVVTLDGTNNTSISVDASSDSATVNISDDAADAALVSLAVTQDAAEPGTDGVFTVTIDRVADQDIVVTYELNNNPFLTAGQASSGSDFAALSGTVTILAGQTSATIDVSVLDDSLTEVDEALSISLTGTDNTSVTVDPSGSTAEMTITSDEPAGTNIITPTINNSSDGNTLTGTAEPNSTVQLLDENGNFIVDSTGVPIVVTTDSNGNWLAFDINPDLVDGQLVTALSSDSDGNSASTTEPVGVTSDNSTVDSNPPSAPGINNSQTGDDLTGTSDPGTTVALYGPDGSELVDSNGDPIVVTTNAEGNWQVSDIDPDLVDGVLITAVATDAAGNSTANTEPVGVTSQNPNVDSDLPLAPTINNSSDGDELGGTGEPGTTVTLTDENGDPIVDSTGTPVSAVVDANGNWSVSDIEPNLVDGQLITATAEDAAGNTASTTEPVGVTSDNPGVDSNAPSAPGINNSQTGDDLTGTSDPGTTVALFGPDGNPLVDSTGTPIVVTTDADGNWSTSDICLLYTSPSPRDLSTSRMPSSA